MIILTSSPTFISCKEKFTNTIKMRQYCVKYNYDYIFTNKYDNFQSIYSWSKIYCPITIMIMYYGWIQTLFS